MGLLDRHPFEVAHPDARDLIKFLYQTFSTRGEVQYFALGAAVDLSFVDLDQPAALVWQSVTIAAANQMKLPALVKLISEHPASAHARPFLVRVLNEPLEGAVAVAGLPPAVIPDEVFEAGLLWDDLPFIDRVGLRENLKLMVGPAQRRALLVMGEEGAGKTYTRQFIHYLTEHGGPSCIKPIDMSTRAGAPVDVLELASLVAHAMVGQESPTFDPTAQPETVVSKFVPWLGDEAVTLGEARWLVLDGFTATTATGGALHLVDALARAAANRDLGPLRVIVLGYSGNPASAGLALTEPLHHPTRDDVKVFFARAAAAIQGMPLDNGALEAVVDGFGPTESLPMAELGPRAVGHARDMFGAT